MREAQREFGSESNIELIEAPVDDIWLRDIAPTFAIRGEDIHQEIVAIDWHFASWGNLPDRRRRRGDRLASFGSSVFKAPLVEANFVMEGGAFTVDGQGQMIVTRSCLLHPSRNPVSGLEDRQHRIENDLSRFGISRVIWLEGDPCDEAQTVM
jgi:agmatine deiminase